MSIIHKDIKTFLSELGLTPTETTLYVTSLQFGTQTNAALARHSGIKRTTTHSALSNLIERGLMGIHSQSGVSYYTATDPNLIERKLKEKMETIKNQQLDFINLLPLFEDLAKQSTTITEVASFHGEAGVRTAVDTALYCASKQWKIVAPERNFFSDSSKEYADYFIKIRTQRGIRAKSLWEPNFIKKRAFGSTDFEFRDPRILPNELVGKFKTTVIIFDKSVLFVSSATETSAVLIKSPEISSTMEVLFDGLWVAAKPIPKSKIN